jgi:MFS family permease
MATSNSWFLIRASLIVSGGGFVFGYDIGIISSTLIDIKDSIPMNSWQEGIVVAIIGLGSMFGALVGGPMCDYIGRWSSIQIQNVCFILGAICTAKANGVGMLYFGRFIVGIASAISAIADIPYLAEISPPSLRGQSICMYEIMVSIGVLVSFLVGWIIGTSSDSWRGAYLTPALITCVLSFLMCLLPESPKWLAAKGRKDELRSALMQIYGPNMFHFLCQSMETSSSPSSRNKNNSDNDNDNEYKQHLYFANGKYQPIPEEIITLYRITARTTTRMRNMTTLGSSSIEVGSESKQQEQEEDIEEDIEEDNKSSSPSNSNESGFFAGIRKDTIVLKEYSYLIMVIVTLQALTQFSGGVVVRNYAATIFVDSGESVKKALGFTVVIGIVKLLATVGTVWYIDKIGRRKLLLAGASLVGMGMIVLCIALGSSDKYQANPGFLLGAGIVVGAYGIGYGPIPWALSSEMFPVNIRGKVMAISLISQNLSLLITNLIYLKMIENMTPVGTFAFYFVFNMLCVYLVYMYLPETKERSHSLILNLSQMYKAEPWIQWNRFLQIESVSTNVMEHDTLDTTSQKSDTDNDNDIEIINLNDDDDNNDYEMTREVANPMTSSKSE